MANTNPPKTIPGLSFAGDRIAKAYGARVGGNAPKPASGLPTGAVTKGDALFNPSKTGASTLAQVEAARARVEAPSAQPQQAPGLRPETVAQLSAVHAASVAARAAQTTVEAAPPQEAGPPVINPAAGGEFATPKPEPEDDEALPLSVESLPAERPWRDSGDILRSEAERAAVAKRVKPIDLLDGISTGVFKQVVPIIPGTLTVEYQTISGEDNQALRLLLFKWIDENKHLDSISMDVLSLMQLTASIVHINGKPLIGYHKMGSGNFPMFDEDAFKIRYQQVRRYPAIMLHSMGVHGMWFDQRVRECFTMDNIKKS